MIKSKQDKYENICTIAEAIISSTAYGVISINKEKGITFINKVAQELTGWKSEEALGQPIDTIFNIINPKTLEKEKELINQILSTSKNLGIKEYPLLLKKGGGRIYISIHSFSVENDGGEVVGIIITFQDITDNKRIEDELEIERNNLRIQFQYAPIAMVVVDISGNIQKANDRFVAMVEGNNNIIGAKLGNSLGCINAINSICGESDKCMECIIKEKIHKVIKSRIPFRNIEKHYEIMQNNKKVSRDFRFNLVPINTFGNTNALISIDDMTEYKLMEENLRRSRDFYLTLFNEFPAMVWRAKSNQSIDYLNKNYLSFKGKTLEEALADSWISDIHPDDIKKYINTYNEAFKKKEPYELEYRIKRFDGEYRWVNDNAGPYYNQEESFAGYIGACYDITEEKKIREKLKRYELLSENTRDIILVIDAEGNIIEANWAAVKTYGYSRKELLSKTIYELRMAEDLTKKQLEEAFEKGNFFECIHYKKDGTTFPVEVSTQSTMLGGRKIVISIIRDITERKYTEERLKESESKYRLLFMNMLNGFAYHQIVLDEHGTPIDYIFIDVNEAFEQLIGKRRDEIIGKRATELFANLEMQDFNRINSFGEVALNGKTMNFIGIHSLLGGKWFNITVYSYEKYRFAAMYYDITEQMKIESEIHRAMKATKAAYKAKSEFLANMSHEIRTPLNGIIGMIDLSMLSELSDEQRDNLYTAKTCANSLLKIINDILDYSKMEAGKLSIENKEFDLKALIENIVKVHYYQAKEKGIELSYQLPIELPDLVIGDPNRLQQVLNNLLDNAVKFTDHGHISLIINNVGLSDDFIELKFLVVDTGIGIPKEEKGKLFKSFSQIDGSHTRRFGGTGLGLAISKQLIEMMGGILNLESEKHKGSTFSFTLKLEIAQEKDRILSNIESIGIQKAKENARILLVEDDEVNRKVIGKMLKKLGYDFDVVENGNAALEMLCYKEYDLCLMDIQMPGLDGTQTAGIIRQKEKGGETHMPIIAVSAHALRGDRERFLALGMNDYIAKPFQISELYTIIEKWLNRKTRGYINGYLEELFTHVDENNELNNYILNCVHEIRPIIHEIKGNINKLEYFIGEENIEAVEDIAHHIKNLATSINADKIKTLGFRIELAARREDKLEARKLYKELQLVIEKYIDNITKVEDLE